MGDSRLEPLVLSEAERRTLENWAKRRRTAQGLALRARIVLACADGGPNLAVAARLGVNRGTVSKWRARFLRKRLDGLSDEPRPGVPRTITDAQVEEVVVRTLEEVPEGATHWSKRELAKQVGISPASVLRIWHAFGLQPWRTEDFKISPDPLLIDKIRDVVGLYLAPPANAAVFSVDEKPQIQALERTAPVLPMMPGVPERRSFDYTRHGTIDLFAALNIATGAVIGKCYRRHRQHEFLKFLNEIDSQVPKEPGVEIHIVLDNYGTHKTPRVKRWFALEIALRRIKQMELPAGALLRPVAILVAHSMHRLSRCFHHERVLRKASNTRCGVFFRNPGDPTTMKRSQSRGRFGRTRPERR